MRIDFISNPADAERFAVLDPQTEEEYEDVAWADDEIGIVAVFRTRSRTLADRKDADLRLRRPDGQYDLDVCHLPAKIVRRDDNPWKATLLELLHDPDVIERLQNIVRSSYPLLLDRAAVAREIEAVMRRKADLLRERRERTGT